MNNRSSEPQSLDELLAICSSEDLSRLGMVQPHGCLFGLSQDGTVRLAAGNSDYFVGLSATDALGLNATSIRLPDGGTIADWVENLSPTTNSPRHASCRKGDAFLADVYCHRTEDLVVLELVAPNDAPGLEPKDLADHIEAVRKSANVFAAAALVVNCARKLSGYDRAMVYRFLPDTSGDVIAESRESDLVPYIGLRYPGSDIPVNARNLYLKSPIRVVADAMATPCRVETVDASLRCDLSLAVLRAVSPFHIQYLKNMGVGSSLVTSIIVQGKLWGLVACHRNHAFIPSEEIKAGYVQLTNSLSEAIERIDEINKKDVYLKSNNNVRNFLGELSLSGRLWYTSLFGKNRFISLMNIHGCAIRIGDDIFSIGYCPPYPKIWWLEDEASSVCLDSSDKQEYPVWTCTNIKSIVGSFPGHSSGVAYVLISDSPRVSVMLFRNELKREVFWGGNPEKAMDFDHDSSRISPRQSFARWIQEVSDTCDEWTDVEIDTIRNISTSLRSYSKKELSMLLAAPGNSSPSFSDIIFKKDVSEVRSVIEDFIPDGIATVAFTASPDPKYLNGFANATFCEFFGLSRAEADETKIQEILALSGLDNAAHDLVSSVEKTIEVASPKFGQRLVRVRRMDLLCRHTRAGEVEGITVLYMHDETERQRTLDALDVARRQSRATSMFKAQMLGGLSHELRTPLNAIIGFTEMLTLGLVTDPAKTNEYLHTVLEAGRQMLSLVDGVLDIAKIERGILQISEELFDVWEELDTVRRIASEHASAHSQVIDFNMESESISLLGDKTAFRQMILNLLSNAVKFSPPGGTIILQSELSPLRSLHIRVEDSGPGVSLENRDRIFEPFSQIEGVEVRSRPGAGIGLSIVKAYAELHGGTVTIEESTLGGAIFTVKFPSWRVRA